MVKNRLALCVMGATLCAAGPALAGDGTNLLKMIPAESQIVLVFDVADARDSALLQKGWDSLIAAKPDARAKLAEIGLDPMKDIDTVLFAGSAKADDMEDLQSMVIIVEGRVPAAKLASVPGVVATKYLGTTIWSKDETDVAMVGPRLFFTKKGKMKGAIDVALGKGKGKGANAAVSKKAAGLRKALASADTTADLWMAIILPEKAKAGMKAQGMSADAVSVGVNFTADIGTSLRLLTDSEATAGKLVSMLQSQFATIAQAAGQFGLAKAAKSLLVSQDKATVNLSLTLTEAELQSLMNLAGVGAAAASSPPATTPGSRPMTGASLRPPTGAQPTTP